MKITLIALLALAGVSMAVEVKTVDILTLPSSINRVTADQHGTGWNGHIGGRVSNNQSQTHTQAQLQTAVQDCLTSSAALATEGWHWGVANGSQEALSGEVSVDTAEKSITYKGRWGYDGEFVAATLDVADLLAANEGFSNVASLTLTFTPTIATFSTVSVWHYDTAAGTATALMDMTNVSTGAEPMTLTAGTINAPLELTDGKIFVLFNSRASGVTQTISGFSATAMLAPEPATATLSLLALAGLAARRRRH